MVTANRFVAAPFRAAEFVHDCPNIIVRFERSPELDGHPPAKPYYCRSSRPLPPARSAKSTTLHRKVERSGFCCADGLCLEASWRPAFTVQPMRVTTAFPALLPLK